MKFKIVVPSLGRAELLVNHPYLEQSHVVVRKDQINHYKKVADIRKRHPLQWIVLPNDVVGLGQTRVWMNENLWADDEDFIFHMDDDISTVRYLMTGTARAIAKPEYMLSVINHVAEVASTANAGIFGFAHTPRPQERKWSKPFVLRGWVSGHALGVLKRSIKWDSNCVVKSDVDISLESIRQTGIVWCDSRWNFDHDIYARKGGQQSFRTLERENLMLEYLQKKWGTSVVQRVKGRRSGQSIKINVDG